MNKFCIIHETSQTQVLVTKGWEMPHQTTNSISQGLDFIEFRFLLPGSFNPMIIKKFYNGYERENLVFVWKACQTKSGAIEEINDALAMMKSECRLKEE